MCQICVYYILVVLCLCVCVPCQWASLSRKVFETFETLPLVNLVSLLGVNDVGLCNHSLCVYVHLCTLDGEKAVLGFGGDLNGLVHIDVCGSPHCHNSVCHRRTWGR